MQYLIYVSGKESLKLKKMNTTSAVANEFLDLAKKDGSDITNLKLVKMMYIAQGLSLAFFDEPLFDSEIEAWRYGPVIPPIYHEFKHFRDQPITEKSVDFRNGFGAFNCEGAFEPKLDNENKKKVVKLTWMWYKDISAPRLVELTHSEGTPWKLTYVAGENRIIDEELIRKYYKKFLRNMDNQINS